MLYLFCAGTMKAASSKKGDGKLDLGDLLGRGRPRSKDGFQPLRQVRINIIVVYGQ